MFGLHYNLERHAIGLVVAVVVVVVAGVGGVGRLGAHHSTPMR